MEQLELSNSVFISYRRGVDDVLLRMICQYIQDHGIDVFYNDGLEVEKFEDRILSQINARPYVLILLSPNTLAPCIDLNDYMSRELDHALMLRKKIIPIYTSGFEFEDFDRYLPYISDSIKAYNMLDFPTAIPQYLKYALQNLSENFLLPIALDPIPIVADGSDINHSRQIITDSSYVIEAQQYFNRAWTREEGSELQIADYSEAIRLDPNFADAYNNRGLTLQTLGDLEGAIEDFSEAIRVKSDFAEAYNNRGAAYHAQDNSYKALSDYSEAIQLNPTLVDAYCNRSFIYLKRGDIEKAIADCNRAIQLQANYARGYHSLGVIYHYSGKLEAALQCYTTAIKLDINLVSSYLGRGWICHDTGDFDNAIKDYSTAIELDPHNPRFYEYRGASYEMKGDKPKAVENYKSCLTINPFHDCAQYMHLYIKTNDTKFNDSEEK